MEPRRIEPISTASAPPNPSPSDPGPVKAGTKPKGRKGLITLAVLLFLLLIAAGGSSYWLYMKNVKDTSALTDQKNSAEQQLSQAKKDINSAKTATDASDGYYQLKEWGVEFKTTTDTADLTYLTQSGGNTISLSSRSLMSAAVAAYAAAKADQAVSSDCSPVTNALGQMSRYKTKAEIPTASGPVATKTIGNYIYGYTPSQASCSKDKIASDTQTKQSSVLKSSFDSLRTTP